MNKFRVIRFSGLGVKGFRILDFRPQASDSGVQG